MVGCSGHWCESSSASTSRQSLQVTTSTSHSRTLSPRKNPPVPRVLNCNAQARFSQRYCKSFAIGRRQTGMSIRSHRRVTPVQHNRAVCRAAYTPHPHRAKPPKLNRVLCGSDVPCPIRQIEDSSVKRCDAPVAPGWLGILGRLSLPPRTKPSCVVDEPATGKLWPAPQFAFASAQVIVVGGHDRARRGAPGSSNREFSEFLEHRSPPGRNRLRQR